MSIHALPAARIIGQPLPLSSATLTPNLAYRRLVQGRGLPMAMPQVTSNVQYTLKHGPAATSETHNNLTSFGMDT